LETFVVGAHPYWYIEKYQPNIDQTLHQLREREFRAGRYNPMMPFLEFPVHANSPAPGAGHTTIDEALLDADADGTRSILDLNYISDEPEFGAVCPMPDEMIEEIFGTTQPTRAQFEQAYDFWENEIFENRGQGVYVILYKNGRPDEIVFAGYSFD
jgi:hypothetical protein